MFENLLGAEMPFPLKFILAFAVVLALIVAAAWLIRRFSAARLGSSSARGRQPRLAVIDAASVDSRRRLVLIRRDNVEHLVLIGGPTDIVVEQNIVRAVPVAPPREAPPARHGEGAPRVAEAVPRPSQPEPGWVPQPEPVARSRPSEWSPEPAARRPAERPTERPAEPVWQPEPRHGRQAEPAPKAQPPVDLPPRPLPEPVAALRAPAPPQRPARVPVETEQPVEVRQSPPTADVNLADMAQRLEAALRRPARPAEARTAEPRPEPRKPAVETMRPQRPEPRPAPAPAREAAPTREAPPEREAAPEGPRAAAPEPVPAPEPPAPAEPPAEPAPAKSVFASLEEEMANLLSKPTGKP
jgi:flagellar biogenesis protein FliO